MITDHLNNYMDANDRLTLARETKDVDLEVHSRKRMADSFNKLLDYESSLSFWRTTAIGLLVALVVVIVK